MIKLYQAFLSLLVAGCNFHGYAFSSLIYHPFVSCSNESYRKQKSICSKKYVSSKYENQGVQKDLQEQYLFASAQRDTETTTNIGKGDRDIPDISQYIQVNSKSVDDDEKLLDTDHINRMTRILLSSSECGSCENECYPIGLLPMDIMDAAINVILNWSKTCSAQGAETVDLIIRRLELERDNGNQNAVVTSKMYSLAIDAWAKSNDPRTLTHLESIISHMENAFLSGGNVLARPSASVYNAVISSYARWITTQCPEQFGYFTRWYSLPSSPMTNTAFNRSSLVDTAKKAASFLDKMRLMGKTLNAPDILPTTFTYNLVLSGFAKCGLAREAEDLLFQMIQASSPTSYPDTISYNSVIHAWSRSGEKGAAQRAESILNMMEEMSNDMKNRQRHFAETDFMSSSLKPDSFSYSGVIYAYARCGQSGTADHVLELLERMEQSRISLNSYVCNAALDCLAKSGDSKGALQADMLLTRMESLGIATSVSYNTCINAHAKSRSVGSGKAAEALLTRIEASEYLRPDVVTYTSTITAITRSGESKSAERAEAIVERMFQLAQAGDKTVEPNTATMNSVLHSYATSGDEHAAQRAEEMLEKMERMYASGLHTQIQPTVISYTTVIDAYAKSKMKDAALHAEKVFRRMEKAYADGNQLAKPNVQSFNAVINAWVQNGKGKGAARAEQILKKMMELHSTGNVDIRPNVVTFSTVINGWGKCGEEGCAARAQKIFELMEEDYGCGNVEAKPNAFSYSTLIDAWVKNKGSGSIQQAENVYNCLEYDFRAGKTDTKPNAIQVTQIIDGWSQTGDISAGEKAVALLMKLEKLYEDFQNENMRPNASSYTATINAIAKTRRFGKARAAQQILKRMIVAYKQGNTSAKPNVYAFTAVMNACAYTVGDAAQKKEALTIASSTFKDLSDYDQPNEVTFGTYLRVCINLLPRGHIRDSAVASVFMKCCENGLVNGSVLQSALSVLSIDQVEKVMGCTLGSSLAQENLPSHWYRNVVRHYA